MEIQEAGGKPSLITYSKSISACEKLGCWQEADGVMPREVATNEMTGQGFYWCERFRSRCLVVPRVWILRSLVLLCFVVLGWNSGFCDVFVGRGL